MKISPVKFDLQKFQIANREVNKFIKLGHQRGNTGIIHTLFLRRHPVLDTFYVKEKHQLSGYLSYYFVFNNDRVLIGVLFASHAHKTVSSDFMLIVGDCDSSANFEPQFALENCGILIFKSDEGTTLLIPSELDSSMIIKVD